jgi:SAM-dependent methyltransferase
MNVFDEMGKYWSEMADQNPTERQVRLVKKAVQPHDLVLDLACGNGRHLITLAKAGYRMVGLDVSAHLLRIAKGRWHGADLVMADTRFLPFKEGAFEAALSLDNSFGYLPTEKDDAKSLGELKEALADGGVLVVDVFNRNHLTKHYSATSQPKQREYPSFCLQQTRSVQAKGGELRDEWVVSDKADGQTRFFMHVARLYKLIQLRRLLKMACFKVVSVFGDYEGQKLGSDSPRLILVARRI